MAHSREIIDVLGQLEVKEFTGTLWRTSWKTRDPKQGGVAGGRWSPKSTPHNIFTALYTSLDKHVSISELYYHLSQAPVFSSCAMLICELKVIEINLLDLSSKQNLKKLNLDINNRKQIFRSQKIGHAAQFLGHHGIIVPSFRASGKNCVLFLDTLNPRQVIVKSCSEINWPAWIQSKKE